MNMTPKFKAPARLARIQGFSLVELMIGITLGMLVVAAVLALYVNLARTNNEMAKMNRQIENGRFAVQVLHEDLIHAGYWGTYVPQFDDLTAGVNIIPSDAPTALPDPCLEYSAANWTTDYTGGLIGIPVQADLGTCAVATNRLANPDGTLTDTLVVRHAQTCVAGGGGNCDADIAGKMYFQSTRCAQSVSGIAQGGSPTTIVFNPLDASSVDDFYNGQTINIIGGTGAGQSRTIIDYDGDTWTATVEPDWDTAPVALVSEYDFGNGRGYVLSDSGFNLLGLDCATPAEKRQYISNIYYIRDYARTVGDGIPTLMRSAFDLEGGVLKHKNAEALIEGIQGFRVEYGIDDVGDMGDVDYSKGIVWVPPEERVTPRFRGDGIPDRWVDESAVTCTGTGVDQCDAANVVAVRIHVLARGLEPSPGHTDSKTYQLGDQTLGPFNDKFKRQVFSSTARLVNPSGRRETP
jgi:Tfp pilus assembly protein PilW